MRWGPTRRVLASVIGGLLLLGSAATAGAVERGPVTRALLIGAGDYPGLPPALRLQAPSRDAERLARALHSAGLPQGAIELMTDREGVRPTRAAILARLDAIAQSALAGDALIIYFSGHGAQAAIGPARAETELFLAADARPADRGAPPGTISSGELRASFAAILSRGADIWFIADTCHAAGLLRSGGRVKSVSARALGLGAAVAGPEIALPVADHAGWGRLTGFYAADADSLALERNLPAGAPDAAPTSVFTFALARGLAQGRLRSYRDLALAITSAEDDIGVEAPAPRFEGALDRALPGLSVQGPRGFALHRSAGRLLLDAGALEGFDAGAQVEVLTRDGDKPVGLGRVIEAGLTQAVISMPVTSMPGTSTPETGASPALQARLLHTANLASGISRGERLLALLKGRTTVRAIGDLGVETLLWRPLPPVRAGGLCAANPSVESGAPVQAKLFDTLQPPALHDCDVVYLRLRNHGPAGLDVSPLYVEATGRIGALGLSGDDTVRIEAGGERLAAVRLVTRDGRGRLLPQGMERLVLVVLPADPDAPAADLRALADPELRAGGRGALVARMARALDGPVRGEGADAGGLPDRLGAVVIAWRAR